MDLSPEAALASRENQKAARNASRRCEKAWLSPEAMARRERFHENLRGWLLYYFPLIFFLQMSDDHDELIGELQSCIIHGGKHCRAMPRGSGKTSIGMGAILFSILEGHRRFPVGIAATADESKDIIEFCKSSLQFNERIAEDYPQLAALVREIEGKAIKAKTLLSPEGGEVAMIWGTERIVLPTYDCPLNYWSGNTVEVRGITGAIRGMKHITMDGEIIRPDFVFADDAQTRESANSPKQTGDREKTINGDILKLAGPTVEIAAYNACTVIAEDDLSDRMLDRQRNPTWRGRRISMLIRFPKAEKTLWKEYGEVRAQAFREEDDAQDAVAISNKFYAQNRKAMDDGAEVYWDERFKDSEISAIQSAMNEFLTDRKVFYAEFQNDPVSAIEVDQRQLTSKQVSRKLNGMSRREIPVEADHLVAHVDVMADKLYYTVAAFRVDMTGWIIEYGTHPPGAGSSMEQAYSGKSLEGRIRAGLDDLEDYLFEQNWTRADDVDMPLERLLVDSSWGQTTMTVYEYTKQSTRRGMVYPAHGLYVGPGRPFNPKKKSGRRMGDRWYQGRPPNDDARVRLVSFDTNHWKSFLHRRFQTPAGQEGCITLWGDDPEQHDQFGEHITSERMTRSFTEKGGQFDIWRLVPNRENHWLDTTAGCCVAAAMLGCSLEKKRKRKVNQHDKPKAAEGGNDGKKSTSKRGGMRGGGGFATNW